MRAALEAAAENENPEQPEFQFHDNSLLSSTNQRGILLNNDHNDKNDEKNLVLNDLDSQLLDKLDLTQSDSLSPQDQAQVDIDTQADQQTRGRVNLRVPARAKPIVSTLLDEDSLDESPESSKLDQEAAKSEISSARQSESIGQLHESGSKSIGKVVEHESESSRKQPSWSQFMDRIYEAFSRSAPQPKTTTTTNQDRISKLPLISHDTRTNDTKPSDFSNNNDNKLRQSQSNGPAPTTSEKLQSFTTSDPIKADKNNKTTTTKLDHNDLSNSHHEQLDFQMDPKMGSSPSSASSSVSMNQNEGSGYSLMRKSTMVLPATILQDNEQVILQQDDNEPLVSYPDSTSSSSRAQKKFLPSSLTLGSPSFFPEPTNNKGENNNNMGAYKIFTRHYQTMGQPIYGPFSMTPPLGLQQAAPASPFVTGYQPDGGPNNNGLNINNNNNNQRRNDIYFLIIVGGFCMMTVAMVLAAGLFAYRVQQARKTTVETDYPTYGVVGPNNMVSGDKLGASFVGGYLAQNAHQFGVAGGKMGSMKGGSAKGSSDGFNSPNDSGIGGINATGSNRSSGKRSVANEMSKRPPSFMASQQNAARMYHYQHQKQQMISSEINSAGRHTSASDLDSEEENEDGNYTVYECPGLASAHDMEIKNPLFHDDRSP